MLRIGLDTITPLLVAGAAVAAIATAAVAAAGPIPAQPGKVSAAPTVLADHLGHASDSRRLHGGGWDGVHGFGDAY